MIRALMRRPLWVLLIVPAILVAACGTQKISVPKKQTDLYHGAVLFSQRCSGCHTLSYAATHGSATNVRTAQANIGPNFNVRCERPAARVLYAIENGGFSGAIMPQNVVVGHDAIDVAKFVATYAGRQAPSIPGVAACTTMAVEPIVPPPTSTTATPAPSTKNTKKAAGVPTHSQGKTHVAAP
jgi:mono/diheme cytochrome c family protein